jgi:hypothetical protein
MNFAIFLVAACACCMRDVAIIFSKIALKSGTKHWPVTYLTGSIQIQVNISSELPKT